MKAKGEIAQVNLRIPKPLWHKFRMLCVKREQKYGAALTALVKRYVEEKRV